MDRAFPQIKIQAQAQLQRQYKRSRFPSGGNHPPSPPHQQQSDAIIKHHSNASGGKKIYTLEIKPSPMKRRKTSNGPRIGMPPLENNSHFSTKQNQINRTTNGPPIEIKPLHSVPPPLQSYRVTRSNFTDSSLNKDNTTALYSSTRALEPPDLRNQASSTSFTSGHKNQQQHPPTLTPPPSLTPQTPLLTPQLQCVNKFWFDYLNLVIFEVF